MNQINTTVNAVVEKIYEKYGYLPNGRLSKFEFFKAFNEVSKISLGQVASKAQMELIFDLIDQNGDQKIRIR